MKNDCKIYFGLFLLLALSWIAAMRVIIADTNSIELLNNSNATNPTYAELFAFIKEDSTDEHPYTSGSDVYLGYPKSLYLCSQYAEAVHNNAEKLGIRAAWVTIIFEGGHRAHALNAFETTDRGLVYIDSTGAKPEDRLNRYLDQNRKSLYGATYIPESLDKVAYIKIGKEYGLIHIDKAKSLSYEFYEDYREKWLEYRELVGYYNDDLMQYHQENSTSESSSGTYASGDVANDYGTSFITKGSIKPLDAVPVEWSPRMEDWKITINENLQRIDYLAEELGDYYFESLGVVESIDIQW
jgi:hypothetical protein